MKCTECHAEIHDITCTINPRKAAREFRTNCGHRLTDAEAHAAWRLNVPVAPIPLPVVDGASLISAERARQIAEEGHTPDKDAELTGDQLPWAAWCFLDRAVAKNPTEQAPGVWPLPRDRWPATISPLRLLTIAAAFIAAEIDRRLAKGETP
jgi:hypothetical protein